MRIIESFEEHKLNEGIIADVISKIPFIKNKIDKVKKVANDVKDELKNIFSELPEKDLKKMKAVNMPIKEAKKEVKKEHNMAKHILNMFGLSTGVLGVLTTAVTAVVNSANNYNINVTPYFIAGVILFVVGGMLVDTDTMSKKPSKIKK